jgi:putative photosynthetic complex assembly protein
MADNTMLNQHDATATLQRRDREMIPRVLVRAMFGLMAISLAVVAFARWTDQPLSALPPQDVAVQTERSVQIFAKMDGSARIVDVDGTLVADLAPNEGGFVAGVSRALARVRDNAGVTATAPVRIIRFEDGRLALRDDLTGWRAELFGFGHDNAAAFARLLEE